MVFTSFSGQNISGGLHCCGMVWAPRDQLLVVVIRELLLHAIITAADDSLGVGILMSS